jgi:tetratricopeptide (TPR) repeat protein
MTRAVELEAIPLVEPVPAHYGEAARLLEKAAAAGTPAPEVAYLLFLAYKRQGKTAEARTALRKIARPDGNVLLQLGLLSLEEGQLAQAEQEFARALEADPACYEACFNLLMTRLTLVQIAPCLAMLPRAMELAPSQEERRFLTLLHLLLQSCPAAEASALAAEGEPPAVALLAELSEGDERRLLKLVRSLGEAEIVLTLLRTLRAARPESAAVQEAHVEATLARAKGLCDRCSWFEAERLLTALVRDKTVLQGVSRPTHAAVLNLVGTCASLNQDLDAGARHFAQALKLAPGDPRIHQNLALAHELIGTLSKAESYWNDYFDLLDRKLPAPPGQPDYHERLAFEGFCRLATVYAERENYPAAAGYVERALQLRPSDTEVLERLFHLYQHTRRPHEARKILARLRELRPQDPQLELYEIDLIDVKGLPDLDRMLTEIDRTLRRYPGDARVEERAVAMVGNVIPLMGTLCDRLTERMSEVIDQVRSLPNYQINWPAVHDTMHDLLREFQKLKRITGKCLPLVKTEEQRRLIRDLASHIDRKMDVCRQMGG